MELDPVAGTLETYSIELLDGECVKMTDAVMKHFKTLTTMMSDFRETLLRNSDGQITIPIVVDDITAHYMNSMIQFYTIYNDLGIKGVDEALLEASFKYDTFYEVWNDILVDVDEMVKIVIMVDYLDASELLAFTNNRLHLKVESLGTKHLYQTVMTFLKRKVDDLEDTTTGELDIRPIRRQYRHAELVYKVMCNLLPCTLVRPIDHRLQKYVNLVSDSNYYTVIRHGEQELDSVFIRRNFTPDDTLLYDNSIASLNRGEQALYRGKTNDVVVGNIFIALLGDEGKLSIYGEYMVKRKHYPSSASMNMYGRTTMEGISHTIIESPLALGRKSIEEECLAVWGGPLLVVALTIDSLYIWGVYGPSDHMVSKNKIVTSPHFNACDVLDVSCGRGHALILTKRGLYGWGANDKLQLGVGNISAFTTDVTKVTVVDENDAIEKIYCAGHSSTILTKCGDLYVTGESRNLYSRVHEGNWLLQGGVKLQPLWMHIEIDTRIDKKKIRLITGDSANIIVVVENDMWEIDIRYGMTNQLPKVNGTILQVASVSNMHTLVTTTCGLYLVPPSSQTTRKPPLVEFGGSYSQSSPYLLTSIPLLTEKEDQRVMSNKKARYEKK